MPVSITSLMEEDASEKKGSKTKKVDPIYLKQKLSSRLISIWTLENLDRMKEEISNAINFVKCNFQVEFNRPPEGTSEYDSFEVSILEGLEQALRAYSLERCRYYVKRAVRSLTSSKIGKINDIDMNRWKSYTDIITDSLWVIERRDRTGAHNAGYWGNFIPQIPQQLLKRYTKKNEWVLDTFAGSGTTLMECQRSGRNAIGIDISREAIDLARENLSREKNAYGIEIHLINEDSTSLSYRSILDQLGIPSVQLVIMHPPYWDIIKFSSDGKDLSNAENMCSFLAGIRNIAMSAHSILDKGRYLALVIGDKYSKGEWIPLGFYSMNEVMKSGFKLKSTVVKNYDITRGKKNQQELWRYRALMGGFYVFKHEYIFLFQK